VAYPSREILEEVGRITIAGSRLDLRMGMLWWHLDRSEPEDARRKALGRAQAKGIVTEANKRLTGELLTAVLEAVKDSKAVRTQRNDVVHQDRVLRLMEVATTAEELTAMVWAEADQVAAHGDDPDRAAVDSSGWRKVPRDSVAVVPGPDIDELRAIERALSAVTERFLTLTHRVANAREGYLPGWVAASGR